MAGRDVWRRRNTVTLLVIEEDIGLKSLQKGPLVHTTKEQRLVNADVPGTQRANDTLVCRRAARGHQRGSER